MTWIRKRERSVLSNGASLLVCGLLAGIVVAAAAFPAVAMSGLAAKAGADAFDHLPGQLSVLPSPQITNVYASDGKTLLAMLYDENRRDVALNDVALVMQQAMVASEDSRFYQHHGVDLKGVARAAVANRNSGGQVSQGASTLTMQYVRQALSYSARTNEEIVGATEQTPARKLREMKFALALEKRLTKPQILERYLNISSFGHGAYGIFAASQVYFGKEPKDLNLAEAALLAGLVKAPSSYDPVDTEKRPEALGRREYVLRQMVQMKYITPQQADEAKVAELKIVGQRPPADCASMPRAELGAGFFCDFLIRWWLEQKAFGGDPFERENRLKSGGYKIITTLDLGIQTSMRKNIDDQLKTGRSEALLEAAVVPGNGHVAALATNRVFSNDSSHNGPHTDPKKRSVAKSTYPNTSTPLITGGGEVVGYQGGSTFKIFTLVAALEKGLPLDYTINAVEKFQSEYIISPSSPAACNGHFYCPENASKSMAGVKNMWTGFGQSVNTYFVPLQQTVGAEHVIDAAKRLGIQFRARGTPEEPINDYERANNRDYAHQWGAFTLGVSATTPLDIANAFATLANDGVYCAPTPVIEIIDSSGHKLDTAKPNCRKAVEPEVARAAVDAARCPMGDQSAFGRCGGSTAPIVKGTVNRPVAGKTGTTEGGKNAALVAMTRNLAIGAIETDPDWQLNPKSMSHDRVNISVARTLRDASAGKPVANFAAPRRETAFGKRVGIANVKCQTVDSAKSRLRNAGFTVNVEDTPVASDCPPGSVAKTEPSGETSRNGVVTIYISRGPGNPGPGSGTDPGVPDPDPGRNVGPPGRGGGDPPGRDRRCRMFPWLCEQR